jgi:hypothetical protein
MIGYRDEDGDGECEDPYDLKCNFCRIMALASKNFSRCFQAA